MDLSKVKLIKFIKKYPRISTLVLLLVFFLICIQPISLKQKIMVPIRGVVLGFIVAAFIWYLKYKSKSRNQ